MSIVVKDVVDCTHSTNRDIECVHSINKVYNVYIPWPQAVDCIHSIAPTVECIHSTIHP